MRAASALLALALLACCLPRAGAGCAAGCEAHGTCHAPLGRCDCPRYFAGADCSRRATPSCVVDAASGLDTGCLGMSTCACMLECEAAGFRPLEQGVCFNYSALEPSVDAMVQAPQLEFGSLEVIDPGIRNSVVEFRKGPWARVDTSGEAWRFVAQSECAGSCSGWGYCRRHAASNATACVCVDEHAGDDGTCELHQPERHCLGDCSGRGACDGGVCVCAAGSYGADCSLTGTDAEQLFWTEDRGLRPRIYVYTLPPRLNSWYRTFTPHRDLGALLHERLLSSRYRTADPEEADFFFVPISPMGVVNHYQAVRAARWVRRAYPYWDRKQGADHVYAFPWDFGATWVGGHPLLRTSVFVSHFGLEAPLREYACDCPSCAPSYTAGKDVVVPDTFELLLSDAQAALFDGPDERRTSDERRTTLLFFAGTSSGPARQALFDARLAGPGVRVVQSPVDLAREMRASIFCISAPGAGFGTRFTLAVVAGCIPVSFVDAVREPFEDVVDFAALAVRIPQARLADMVAILRNVSAADVAAKQEQLRCVRPHFVWSSALGALGDEDGGADAFETLMYALRRRVTPGPHPLLGCATAGVPGAPKPLRAPCRQDDSECVAPGRNWPAGGAACGAGNERPC